MLRSSTLRARLRHAALAVAAAGLVSGCGETTRAPEPVAPSSSVPVESLGSAPSVETPAAEAARFRTGASDPESFAIEKPAELVGGFGDGRPSQLMPEDPANVGGGLGQGSAVDLVPALPEPEKPFRERRRMDIDQLEAALLAATGGVTWMVGNNNQFEALARTLGKPDYLDLTNEDLEPGALFSKFLDDAARSVCETVVSNDLAAAPADRVLFLSIDPESVDAEAVDANLSELLLRFHGRHVSGTDPHMASWRWLWTSAEHVSKDPVAAWKTVCVALINHPDFYTY